VWVVSGRAWRYWLWSFGQLQLFYALIFYPAFSLVAGFGDWPQIYGSLIGRGDLPTGVPELRPWAIGVAVTHAALLALWWQAKRSPALRRALLERYAQPSLLEHAERVEQGGGVDDYCALAIEYARLGETDLAERTFREAAATYPDQAVVQLNWARFEAGRGRADRALTLYGEALSLATDPRLRVLAREGLAHAELEHGRARVALRHLDHALAIQRDDPALRLLRARVRWILKDRAGAELDLESVEASGVERALSAAAALRAEMGGG
jgi:tetratricopeptide (TPR) repeat protein